MLKKSSEAGTRGPVLLKFRWVKNRKSSVRAYVFYFAPEITRRCASFHAQ
jgi:hypothetical protein